MRRKAKSKWPGIVKVETEGSLAWQAEGLTPPAAIRPATEAYLEAENLFAQWLEDECDAETGNEYKWDTVEALFASWSEYANKAGEKAGTKKAFSQSMLEKFQAGRKKSGGRQHRVFLGVRKKVHQNCYESSEPAIIEG